MKDFREFLNALKEKGELIEVNRPISLNEDVGKALRKSSAQNGPAIQFNNNGTSYPLVGGVYNTRSKALLAFQSTEETIFDKILKGLNYPILPILVDKGETHENILLNDDIDLFKLPIPKYSPMDGGAYITPAIVVSTDPETHITDLGNYRFQVIDKQSLSFLAQPNHRLGKHIAKARKRGLKTYNIALVIGVDPIIAYTCQFQLTDSTNDYAIAGGLKGSAVELVKCQTIDVQVPSHAEFVLELEVDLTQNVFEGPLGEYTGYYTQGSLKPIARVKAITHRNDPYFQALLTGIPPTENHILKQIPFESSFLNEMQKSFPTLKKVAIPPSGGVSFYMVLGIEPRFAGEAKQAILAAMASNLRPKIVIAVNPDIDVQNSAQVEWAISFRMQPHENVFTIDQLPAGPLDPCILDNIPLDERQGSTLGIDATYPFGSIVDDGNGVQKEAKGKLYFKVADVPFWNDYNFPELIERNGRSINKMPEINHEIKLHASLLKVYQAIATIDGLKGWHTENIDGENKINEVITFKEENTPVFKWKILQMDQHKIVWECIEGPGNAPHTKVSFILKELDDQNTSIILNHTNRSSDDKNFAKCNTLWGILLLHLKNYVEKDVKQTAILKY